MKRSVLLSPLLPLVLPGCGSSHASPAPTCPSDDALVAASDYLSSAVGAFAADGGGALTTGVDLGADPALTTSRGRAFYVARDQDALFEIDPRCGTPLRKTNLHVGTDGGTTNPQDVAVSASGALWVARFNVPTLLVLDPDGRTRTVDLSSYDGDGNPNMSSVRIADVGGVEKAFVTLERLDDNDLEASKQPSFMLRIDTTSLVVDQVTTLAGWNPFGLMVEANGALWLAEPRNFDAIDEPLAGVERFDPQTGVTQLLVTETALGGSVAEVAVTTGCGVAIIADASPKNLTALVSFDPATGVVFSSWSAPIFGPTSNYALQGLAWKGDVLFVGDRTSVGGRYGVHVFDRSGACTLKMRPDVVFLSQAPVALRAIQ